LRDALRTGSATAARCALGRQSLSPANGGADGCLALISDLVDSGAIEVIGHDADSTAEMLNSPAHPALLLGGKPDALALAHERIAGEGMPGGQIQGGIGFALCMAEKEAGQEIGLDGQGPDELWSVVLLQSLDGLDTVLTQIAASPDTCISTYQDFRSGKPSATGPRTLLVVKASWPDLRLLTQDSAKATASICRRHRAGPLRERNARRGHRPGRNVHQCSRSDPCS
jgi:hypothetical protein